MDNNDLGRVVCDDQALVNGAQGRRPPGFDPSRCLVDDWHPIGTAPKDGSVIWLTAFDDAGEIFEVHVMQWAHIQQNGLFPGKTGMWTHPTGAYTWNDDGDGGPTHWLPTITAYIDHASGMSPGTAETLAAQGEAGQPDPKGDAQVTARNNPSPIEDGR